MVFRSREVFLPEASRSPLDARDLAQIAGEYQAFVDRCGWLATPRGDRARASEALVARTRLMDVYRRFPALDPQLPQRLKPAGWPCEQARHLFEHGYDGAGATTPRHGYARSSPPPGLTSPPVSGTTPSRR